MRLFKTSLVILVAAITAGPLQSQERALGDWHGVLETPTGRLTLLFMFREDSAGIRTGHMVSLDQNPGRKIALTDVAASASRLTFSIPSIGAAFEGQWNDTGQVWSGVFRQGATIPLSLKRGPPPATAVVEGLDGTWRGSLQRGAANLRLVLRVRTTPYGTRVTLDSPDMGISGVGVEQLARAGDAVRFQVPASQVQFSGTLTKQSRVLSGTWSRAGQAETQVAFARDSAPPPSRVRTQWPITAQSYRVEEVTFANPDDARVTLAGTMTIPDGKRRFPAVVLISGSGPQDRDETVFGHKPFAVLADHLSRRGIAVLRYDDRGFGASTGDHARATSADFATDANAAVRYLLGRPEVDPKAIGLIGHSEGGMIGPIAAVSNDRVAFVVLLAGPGTVTDQLLVSQRRLIGLSQGATNAQLDESEPVFRDLLRAVREAADSADAVARVRAVLTNEALATLGATSAQRDAVIAQLTTPWMRCFLAYDPSAFLPRLRVPVLAIGGSLDRQVPSPENLGMMRTAFAGNPDATIRELPGLNHFFQTARTGAIGEYDTIEETFAPSAMAVVSEWVLRRFGPGRAGGAKR